MREIDLGDFLMACRRFHKETGTVVSFGWRGELCGGGVDYDEQDGMDKAEEFLIFFNAVLASRSLSQRGINPCLQT